MTVPAAAQSAVGGLVQPSVLRGGMADRSKQVEEDIRSRVPDLQRLFREYPIAPPDTSSPRASLESFLVLLFEANRIWRGVRDEYQDSGNVFLSADQERRLDVVRLLIAKARQVFDLDDIPQTARDGAGTEIVLQFQEILDRIYMPDLDSVPGQEAGAFIHAREAADLPDRWTIPGTSIVFARVGKDRGEVRYLVSKETVSRIPDDYEAVKLFPSRSDTGEDLYAYYIYTPGNLVAPRWYDLVLAGPDWLRKEFKNQAVWQWISLGLLSVLAFCLPIGLQRWNRWRAVPLSDVRRRLRRMQQPILLFSTILAFRYLADHQVNITGVPMIVVGTVSEAIMWAGIAWLAYQAVDFLASWVTKNPAVPTGSLDSSLLLSAFRLAGLALAVVLLGYGATRIGIPVYGVIAGLGVGGLAVALAAQPTLENLIGGVILYADRMVRVGEYCEFDGLSGTVEAIGIRSTRIRALDRTIITVSNSDLAKRKIVNFSRRDRFLLRHMIGLRYETDPGALLAIITAVREYLVAHPKVADQVALRVSFVGYGDYSLDLELFTYIATADRTEFLAVQEQILLEIGRIVRAHGSDFAFPSSITYLGRDDGLPEAEEGDGNGETAATSGPAAARPAPAT
ncbi:mechanosensitive ion channel family protein [Stappia sp.]|uniref:mechanosensitive ion channel family protein n=1 Tax=Stappia sp. TaxID=1870903 RepID=UPI003A993A85